ncbi:hypothetical protein L6452_14065 [Arctium lappa]|uniref:Uncharacterized protein n=1 Tax=Arctium lappa TaxID=4217 RepID=A0ACB9CJV4_ARCLA|nr:hypothetical protein L6452_14065 [Arctium lappa]
MNLVNMTLMGFWSPRVLNQFPVIKRDKIGGRISRKELLEVDTKKLNEKEKFDGSWNVVRRRRFQNKGMGKPNGGFQSGDSEQKKLVNYWLELKSDAPDHIKEQWSNNAHCDIQPEEPIGDGDDVLCDSDGAPHFMKVDGS